VTGDGVFVVSYARGFPVGRFEPAAPPPAYTNHFALLQVAGTDGGMFTAKSAGDWEARRRHTLAHMERVMGSLPNPATRVPLDVKVYEEVTLEGGLVRRKLSFQSDVSDRVAAYLFLPGTDVGARMPAVLCLQQTTQAGKAEPAGLAGDPTLHYALHLARRGFVTLAPDYPGFGDSKFDFASGSGRHYASGSIKAVWDNVRAVDLLESLPGVDAERIGVIGHSLGGHNAIFTAAFEPRLRVVVSSCGFTTFTKDDMPSWSGPRYMPRIGTLFGNDPAKVPFDFPEVVAALAPRPFLACAAEFDNDFDAGGVREVMAAARAIYALHRADGNIDARYPRTPHSFPEEARQAAYEFLDRHLGKR